MNADELARRIIAEMPHELPFCKLAQAYLDLRRENEKLRAVAEAAKRINKALKFTYDISGGLYGFESKPMTKIDLLFELQTSLAELERE